VILVVSELLSQEQDFRRYRCPATSDDVHKLQSIPQQSPDDEHGVDVASPGDLKSKHESFSFAQNGTGFFANGRKLLEFEPASIHFTNCRGFCGAHLAVFVFPKAVVFLLLHTAKQNSQRRSLIENLSPVFSIPGMASIEAFS
jgi:hypothetical protein